MQSLHNALARKTVAELKALAALLPDALRTGTKDVLINSIKACMAGPQLLALWNQLDRLQQCAVAECLYAPSGALDSRQFHARYGAWPPLNVVPDRSSPRFGGSSGAPTRLRLFLLEEAVLRSTALTLPADLHEPLRRFVLAPAAPRLVLTEVLPEQANDQTLVTRCTEREAIQDLAVLLRLADQGKLAVSDKTAQPSGTTLRTVAEKLSGGDFYPPAADAVPDDEVIGPIKAFAWPMLLQAAGLMQRNGVKSALSPAGRKALSSPAAEVLRTLWQKWLKNSLLDEFSRIDAIKGQRSKGPVMTAVAPRRAAIASALCACPPGAWVAVDELSRYMQAAELVFQVAHDPWKLYIAELQYGSLGYDGSNGWEILQLRYILCFLFETAATLGLVDVAFVEPVDGRPNFSKLWGADMLAFLSRYDGLLYIRLTPLGAFCVGLADHYSPAAPQTRAALQVLPSLVVQVQGGPLAPEETAVLDTWGVPVSDTAWLLDRQKAIVAVEHGIPTSELRTFLESRDAQPLPDTVLAFMRSSQTMGQALQVLGPALLIKCLDADIAQRIASHPETASLCTQAGERRLVVQSEHAARFRSKLHVLGFGMLG
jgi:hypothetical protein